METNLSVCRTRRPETLYCWVESLERPSGQRPEKRDRTSLINSWVRPFWAEGRIKHMCTQALYAKLHIHAYTMYHTIHAYIYTTHCTLYHTITYTHYILHYTYTHTLSRALHYTLSTTLYTQTHTLCIIPNTFIHTFRHYTLYTIHTLAVEDAGITMTISSLKPWETLCHLTLIWFL